MMENRPKIAKMVFLCFSESWHDNIFNLNVLEFISRDPYLIFAILFSSKFQMPIFNQRMRPKSGLKSPRPLEFDFNKSLFWLDLSCEFKTVDGLRGSHLR